MICLANKMSFILNHLIPAVTITGFTFCVSLGFFLEWCFKKCLREKDKKHQAYYQKKLKEVWAFSVIWPKVPGVRLGLIIIYLLSLSALIATTQNSEWTMSHIEQGILISLIYAAFDVLARTKQKKLILDKPE